MPAYKLSDAPLAFVLNGRFLRMAQMCSREIYAGAGGADERVFIQDESLPLRLACHAKRFIALKTPTMFIPQVEGQLSLNTAQLNHDRFLAHYYLLQDYPELPPDERKLLIERCVSAAWKQERINGGAAYASGIFWKYLLNKAGMRAQDALPLDALYRRFSQLPNVRRMPAGQQAHG